MLQPFAYDEADPYVAGAHRGIDIGADAAGEAVVAPAAGTVGFAGWVPTSGETVTIVTADGYSVTLTHLGSLAVAKGATVAEGDPVGTIGPSGTAEVAGPYVHLGIRVAADPNGYVDPLGLLPAPTTETPPAQTGSPAPQPSTSSGSSAAPASAPAPVAVVPTSAPQATETASTTGESRVRVSRHGRGRARAGGADARPARPAQPRPVLHPAHAAVHRPPHAAAHPRVSSPTGSRRRPVAEAEAPAEPTGLGAGHEPRPGVNDPTPLRRSRPRAPSVLLPLVCNGIAALVALAAAFAAASGRRRGRAGVSPAGAQVLHLPRRLREHRRAA